jgi:hypothetical protein
MTKRDVDELQGKINHPVKNPEEELVPAPEKIKKASDFVEKGEINPDMMTPFGEERQVWNKEKRIPNLMGGYLHIGQTQEEYIENIPEPGYLSNGTICGHPKEDNIYSRCIDCGQMIPWVKRTRKALVKGTKKK